MNLATPVMSSCHMNRSITLCSMEQVLIPITQILQCRAFKHNCKVLLIPQDTHPAGTMYKTIEVLGHQAKIQQSWAA